ncbi:hypothetical protein EXT46_05405 [Pseudoalteromonas sp. CO325X]|uniref:hypothetical protein n=1 Tax=Pseudoalteromonas sp. CO325X TaxID=1777262 RepID=UPI001022A0E1|nr:hypothetical protein [Pseudoalteromonas sp. CO325X]RZF83731.1 hypothetical protein EXT46_05405 [Pseudoalteromonas sp. CO325X]
MYALIQGGESQERVALLFALTRLDSAAIRQALIDHLCKGMSQEAASALNQVPQQNLNRALKRLNQVAATVEQIKELDWAQFSSVHTK